MSNVKFKVGDRVSYIAIYGGRVNKGDFGNVCQIDYGHDIIGVDWDTLTSGHSCDGNARHDHGYNVRGEHIEHADATMQGRDYVITKKG